MAGNSKNMTLWLAQENVVGGGFLKHFLSETAAWETDVGSVRTLY